jgi:5-methylthioadenosine/S-adenosylhomocysteine deaminase
MSHGAYGLQAKNNPAGRNKKVIMRTTRLAVICLIACALAGVARSQDVDTYAFRGTLVTPSSIVPNGTLLITGDKIVAAGANIDMPADAKSFETDSFLFPGLIDLHNHLTWNLFPRWPPADWKPTDWDPTKKFGARYDWQHLQSYKDSLDVPHRILFEEGWGCEMNRYGEVKALAGGATSSVGSLGPQKCIEGLARDLDFYSGFYQADVFNQEKLVYNVFPFEMPVADAESVRTRLSSGQLSSFVIHVAEGAADNASAAREYRMLVAQGFLRPGVSIIHGVALKAPQFQEMAAHAVGLIWSPRSNFELYGTTADIRSAKNAGVVIAIAPDWTPSGSSGMLEEMKYADVWNSRQRPKVFEDVDLVKMATSSPAQLAGLGDKIGSLSRGFFADLLLIKRKGSDPYAALLHANPLDVRLVVVAGKPVYGDRELMEKLLPQAILEPVTICRKDTAKVLFLGAEASQGGLKKTWHETEEQLALALRQWNIPLADLAEDSDCGK